MNIKIKNTSDEMPKNGERIWMYRLGFYSYNIVEGHVDYTWHNGDGGQITYESMDDDVGDEYELEIWFIGADCASQQLSENMFWWSIDDTFDLLYGEYEKLKK
jgi:hypothetical protein